MPAGMSWKEMVCLEYDQMEGEGYDMSGLDRVRDRGGKAGFHLAAAQAEGDEAACRAAWAELRERKRAGLRQRAGLQQRAGLRQDFPYREPDGLAEILSLAEAPPALKPVSGLDYEDRVFGAWFARCAAVVLGKPLEMGFDRLKVKEYLESVDAYPLRDWVPARSEKLDMNLRLDCLPSTWGNVRYVQSDDDIHYTICALLLMEAGGEGFTQEQAAQNLLDNITYNWVWTADKYLYYQLVNREAGDKTPLDELAWDNPYRESMCPQLKADLFGYLTPGDPRRGAAMIHRLGSLSASKNGLYGGMFMQGCVSAAMTGQPDVQIILRGGLSNIPRTSRLYEAVRRVMDWYRESGDWVAVCDKIYECYGHWYFAGAINNICFIVLALLEGNLDLEKTMCTAVMCGTDTDCNSANAGSVVGAAVGLKALDPKWIAPLNDTVKSCVAGFGFGTISGLARRTVRAAQAMGR